MSKVLQDEKETCRVAGTTEYCSPEQIQFEPLSSASDMWSVGVIAYVLLSKISPFNPAQDGQEKHETQNAVINCTYDFDDSSWSSRSAEAKSFIQTLLIRAPQVSKDTKKKDAGTKDNFNFPIKQIFSFTVVCRNAPRLPKLFLIPGSLRKKTESKWPRRRKLSDDCQKDRLLWRFSATRTLIFLVAILPEKWAKAPLKKF